MVLPKLSEVSGQEKALLESVGTAARLYSAEHTVSAAHVYFSKNNYDLVVKRHEETAGTGDTVRCLNLVAHLDGKLDDETFRLEAKEHVTQGWYKLPNMNS